MAWYDFLNAANARGRDAGSIARQRLSARAAIPATRAPAPRGGGLNLGLVNPVTAAYSIPGFAEERERNMDYVRKQSRGPLNELNYIGSQLLQGRLPYASNSIQDRPVVNPQFLRPDYSGAGERARRFQEYRSGTDIPGANTDYSSRLGRAVSPASPAAERAYRQEVSSVAQQAAQNPELQRYEKERAAAAASKDQGKMDAVRDLGMEMWAKANPTLAAKVKAGQSGYDAIQRTLGAGQMGSPMNFGFDASSPLATTPPVAAPSYAGTTPASPPGATPLPSNAFSGMVTTPYDRFNAGQTLTSAPLGMPGAQIPGTYEGATGVQGMGASLGTTPSMFNPSDEKAKALLEAFKNRQFSVQK